MRVDVGLLLFGGLLGTAARPRAPLAAQRLATGFAGPLAARQNLASRGAAARRTRAAPCMMCSFGSESEMINPERDVANPMPRPPRLQPEDLKQAKKEVEIWAHWIWPEHAKPDQTRIQASSAACVEDFISDFWGAFEACVQAKLDAEAAGSGVDRWLVLLTAPGVKQLGDYENMRSLDQVLNFCKNGCYPAGDVIRLMHYHPQFRGKEPESKNRWHNEVHAPVPTFAFIICNGKDLRKGNRGPRHATVMGGGRKTPHWRDTAATNLEILFNTAVATSTAEPLGAHGAPDGKIPAEHVVRELVAKWKSQIDPSLHEDEAGDAAAMRLLKTSTDLVVSNSRSPQGVYRDIWDAIRTVTEDPELPCSNPIGNGGFAGRSIVVIMPHYAVFNYGKFDRIAYAMDKSVDHAPLAHTLRVHAFHPEYVGERGEESESRRSPFPLLQISYWGVRQQQGGEEEEPESSYEGPMP
mmetsp:Transcript_10565/g.31894  ORF Transcript_10565/g.31894 Transcript_10565/m.31894 type:complete len:467 (-) Transcript_10565:533-1933(-)